MSETGSAIVTAIVFAVAMWLIMIAVYLGFGMGVAKLNLVDADGKRSRIWIAINVVAFTTMLTAYAAGWASVLMLIQVFALLTFADGMAMLVRQRQQPH